jgi:hypothetical protein
LGTDFRKTVSKKKHILVLFAVILASVASAQDKLFFKNGNSLVCKILAISENTLTYRDTAANATQITVSKSDVLLA